MQPQLEPTPTTSTPRHGPAVPLVIDESLKIKHVGSEIESLFKVSPDVLLDKWLEEVMFAPDPEVGTVQTTLESAKKGWADRFVIVLMNGGQRLARLQLRQIPGGYEGLLEPMKHHYHAGYLMRQRAQWRTVVAESADGIALLDAKFKILECNAPFIRCMTLPETNHACIGEPLLDHLHADFGPLVRAYSMNPDGAAYNGWITHNERRLKLALSHCRCPSGQLTGYSLVVHDATDEIELHRLATAIGQTHDAVVLTDKAGTIQYVNPAFEELTGYTREEAVGNNPRVLKSGVHDAEFYADMWATLSAGQVWRGRIHNVKKDGTPFIEDASISPLVDENGATFSYVAVKKEITEQLQLEAQLRQAQKLESIGQLAAGIAHEINTPAQYVSDNMAFLKRAFGMLASAASAGRDLLAAAKEAGLDAEALTAAKKAFRKANLDFLLEEVPDAIAQSQEGLGRVSHIVGAMKEFSHPSNGRVQPVDINHGIETTVTVARSEWKLVADVDLQLDPDLPEVPALRDELNQVVLNILVNAAHAISAATNGGEDGKGTITIRTGLTDDGESVFIRISDTGTGIPPDVVDRIFDPFFTTKEVGKGTGQGLAIANSVVTDKHGGRLRVETEEGHGTTLIAELPLIPPTEVRA